MIRVLIKLILLFLLVYAGVTFSYSQLEKRLLVVPVDGSEQSAVSPSEEKSEPLVVKDSDYQVIVGRNIFEAVLEQKKEEPKAKEPEPAKVVEKEPEKTKLQLVLHGTVSGSSEQDSRAIIVDQKARRQDLYQVGDAVQGALITSIERGKVVLELNGKKQLLLLKENTSAAKGGTVAPFSSGKTLPKKTTFTRKPSRTAFSRNSSTPPPPKAVPHRRISFRQDSEEQDGSGAAEYEEPEMPLDDEDLSDEEVLPVE